MGFLVVLGIALALSGPIAFVLVMLARSDGRDLLRRIDRIEGSLQLLKSSMPASRQQPVPETSPQAPAADLEGERAVDAAEQTPADEETAPDNAIPESLIREQAADAEWQSSPAASETSDDAAGSPHSGPEVLPRWGWAEHLREQPTLVSRNDIEKALGANWTVWIGGVALALGGIFLVRYSIEQGYIGPAARCTISLLFGLGLAAGGEYMRRREREANFAAPIPAILTAAGTIVAFGAIYAAHGLYGLIGPSLAFTALGVVAVAAIAAAGLHGPALAALGLAGACLTPLLVTSSQPNPWPVVLYIAVATTAAYVLARLRVWLWLACAAAAGAGLWLILLSFDASPTFVSAALAHALVSTSLAAFFLAVLPHLAARESGEKLDPVGTVVIGAFALLALPVLADSLQPHNFSLIVTLWAAALIAIFAFAAALIPPVAALLPVGGAFAVAALWLWNHDQLAPVLIVTAVRIYEPLAPAQFHAFAIFAAVLVAGLGLRRLAVGRELPIPIAAQYASAAAVVPLVILTIVYLRIGRGEASLAFGFAALAAAAVYVSLASIFRGAGNAPATRLALGACAVAALSAVSLGLVFVFDRGMLTVALALAALAAALVSVKLDIPVLRKAVAALGLIVLARMVWEPRIAGADLGAAPIFNWLLFGYGAPAIAFGYAARVMRRAGGEDLPVRVAQALSILFAALLVILEIRHALNGGNPYARSSRLIEQGLDASFALLFSLVLTRIDAARESIVFKFASLGFGAISVCIAAAGLFVADNPYFNCDQIDGGLIFNSLLVGYALPAILAAFLMRWSRGVRPGWFTTGAGCLSIALLFAYACLQTRRLFHGASICLIAGQSQAEVWAYSAVWLALGVVMLVYGIYRKTQGARLASSLFVIAATLKIFLYDLSSLEGLMRALSFIGLGFALIGVGLLYQKFVFEPPPQSRSAR